MTIKKKDILVIGDSHAFVFQHSGVFKQNFTNYDWDAFAVVGATISGIENPNSKTQALPKFMNKLEQGQRDIIILQLGEVDMGFVTWFRAEKYGDSIEKIKEQTISKYLSFIEVVSKYSERIIVLSSPLPTIPDVGAAGDVANQRSSIKASQLERTELTIAFNKKMQELSESGLFEYLNLDSQSLGENGLVDEKLINKVKSDHHYDKKAYAKLLVNNLKNYLEK